MNARQELWALACRLGPRAAAQLRLVAMQTLRRAEPAEQRAEQRNRIAAARADRRWWIFAPGDCACVLGAEAPRG